MEQYFTSESGTVYRLSPDSGNGSIGSAQRFNLLESPTFTDLNFPAIDATTALGKQQPFIDQSQLAATSWQVAQPVDWSFTQPAFFPYENPPACINALSNIQPNIQDTPSPFVPSDPSPGVDLALSYGNAPSGAARKPGQRPTKNKSSTRRVVFSAAQNRALCALYERVANVRLPEREVFGKAIGLNEMQPISWVCEWKEDRSLDPHPDEMIFSRTKKRPETYLKPSILIWRQLPDMINVKIWLQNRRYKEKKSRPASDISPWKYDHHYDTEKVIRAIEYSVSVFNHFSTGFPLHRPTPEVYQPRPGPDLVPSACLVQRQEGLPPIASTMGETKKLTLL